MSQKQRAHRRFRVPDLQGTLQFAHPVTVIDLSRSGAAVETAERLVPDRTYPLQLESRDGIVVTTLGRVVWCKLTGTQENEDGDSAPLYRAGLAFEHGLPDAAARLIDELDQASLEGVDISLRARYKMSDLASIMLLRDRATFEVKTLSRQGLSAEMEHGPRVGSILEMVLPLDQPVEVRGRVADVRPGEHPTRFLVNIDFVGLTPTAQGHLERYIERLRVESPFDGAG
jgi:PilZ domain-containing protein